MNYEDFVPLLAEADESVREVLEENDVFDYSVDYEWDEPAISVYWTEGLDEAREIVVRPTDYNGQVFIEGHSIKDNEPRPEKASVSFGRSHQSLLEINVDAQYGMFESLEPEDYGFI